MANKIPAPLRFLRGFFRALAAVFSAMFGIRRGRAADHDWKTIRPIHIVLAGIVALAAFITTLLVIVNAIVP